MDHITFVTLIEQASHIIKTLLRGNRLKKSVWPGIVCRFIIALLLLDTNNKTVQLIKWLALTHRRISLIYCQCLHRVINSIFTDNKFGQLTQIVPPPLGLLPLLRPPPAPLPALGQGQDLHDGLQHRPPASRPGLFAVPLLSRGWFLTH